MKRREDEAGDRNKVEELHRATSLNRLQPPLLHTSQLRGCAVSLSSSTDDHPPPPSRFKGCSLNQLL